MTTPVNPDAEPWVPDADALPGTPPVGGTGGERGTSAFAGNAGYNADTTPVNRDAPPRGPATGVWYYAASNPVSLGTSAPGGREPATKS